MFYDSITNNGNTMNNCHCDGICKAWTDAGVFHKLQELNQEGVDIYQYFKCLDTQVEARECEVNKHNKRVLVLQNKSNCDISMKSIIDAIKRKNIKCQHCYEVLCQTVRLLSALNILKKHEVIGICNHCEKIIKNNYCKCEESIEAMRSFLKCRLRDWFKKTCNLPCAARREKFRYDRAKQRASLKVERALKIDELFPEFSNLSQRSKSSELESSNVYLNIDLEEAHTRYISKQIIDGKPKELSKDSVNSLDTKYIKKYTVDSAKEVLGSQKQIKKQTVIRDEQGNVSYKKFSDSETKEIKRQAKNFTSKDKKIKDSKAAKPSQVHANNNILKKLKTKKGVNDSSKPEEQSDINIITKMIKPQKKGIKPSKKNDDANSDNVFKIYKPEKELTKDSKQMDKMDNSYDAKWPKKENRTTKEPKQKDYMDSDHILKRTKTEKGATHDLKQKDKMYNDSILKLSKTEKGTTQDLKLKGKTENDSILKLSKTEKGATKEPKQKDTMDSDHTSKSTKTEKVATHDLKPKDKIDNDSIIKLSKTEKGTTKDLKQEDKTDKDSVLKLSKTEKGAKDLKPNYKISETISNLPVTEKVSSKTSKQIKEISEKHKIDANQKPDPVDEIVLKEIKEAKEMKEKALDLKEREKALATKARDMKAHEKIKQEEVRKLITDIEPSNVKNILTATASQIFRFQEKAKEQRNNIGEFNHKPKSMMSSFNGEIMKRLGLDTLPKTGKIKINKDDNISLLEFMEPTKKMQIQRFLSAHSVACTQLDKKKDPVQRRIKKRKTYNSDNTAVRDENLSAENLNIFGKGDGKERGADNDFENIGANKIIVGAEICKYNVNLLPKPKEEVAPLLFKVLERQQSREEVIEDGNVVMKHANKNKNEIRLPTKKLEYSHYKASATNIPKGVIRYALSDRKFIENGWTMLPTQKVVRKMNMYRMIPARPDYDWFTRNKKRCPMAYDTGEKLAEIEESGDGRWFYRNGLVSLDYYSAEETNAQRRIVVYSSRLYENSSPQKQPRPTVLACFDWLGNGVVYDDSGNIRLKYNQTEGVLMDKSLGPTSYWKWHALNDPPVLQEVMIDTQLLQKDPNILKYAKGDSKIPNLGPACDEEMLAIEYEHFAREKTKKLSQKFRPFPIKTKVVKINEQFSLRVLDQASVYLLFRDGKNMLKLNLGMSLDPREIVDTETTEVGEVNSSYDRLPARTESLAHIQEMVANTKKREKYRLKHQRRINRPERQLSIDRMKDAVYKPPQLTNTPYII